MASDADVTLIGRCCGNKAIGLTRFCFLKAFSPQTEVSSFLVFCWASSFRRSQEEAWAVRRTRSLSFICFTELKWKEMTFLLSVWFCVGDFRLHAGFHTVIRGNNCFLQQSESLFLWQMHSFIEHSFGTEVDTKHFTQVLSEETSYCADIGPAH